MFKRKPVAKAMRREEFLRRQIPVRRGEGLAQASFFIPRAEAIGMLGERLYTRPEEIQEPR
jgi:hypothetical protein